MTFFQIDHETGAISTTKEGKPPPDTQTGSRALVLPAVSAHRGEVWNLSIAAVIRRYSAAVNPDYTAHLMLKIKVRLPERDVSVDYSDRRDVGICEGRFSGSFEAAETRL